MNEDAVCVTAEAATLGPKWDVDVDNSGTEVWLTGQIVVYNEIVSVVRDPILAGQSVTVAAQLVIVYIVVL
jgi:hypothetical protein